MVIIEMNPRVSRSSAPGLQGDRIPHRQDRGQAGGRYLLDEIRNDITRETPASFEPTIDYVVTKIPRFAFEKFQQADATLTTQMKSVGEAMAIGRTFKESLQKCLRSSKSAAADSAATASRGALGTELYGDRDDLPRDVIRGSSASPTPSAFSSARLPRRVHP